MMSFVLQLTPDIAGVEPGASVPISVSLLNRSETKDRFELDIEGVDTEWKAVPVPTFEVGAGESRSERIFFKPPRVSESAAGDYPFVVKVRSLESGELQTVQGLLQVKPYHHVSVEISPKRGVISPTRKQNHFEVTFINLGNTEHTLRIQGSDPEDECTYEFENEQLIIGPGQQREVEFEVRPKRSSALASSRLIGFTVAGRSIEVPTVMTSSQAQLEQRPLLSPTTLAAFSFFVLLFLGWLVMKPQPPGLQLSVDPRVVMAGQPVNIRWHGESVQRIVISAGRQVIYDGPDLTGIKVFVPPTAGFLTISAVGEKEGQSVASTTPIDVNVTAPPVVDAPEILRVDVQPKKVRFGEPFTLRYVFSKSVTRATLGPDNIDLNLALDQQNFKPSHKGDNEYVLVAFNSAGQEVRRRFTVNVFEESDAHILAFSSSAQEVTADNPRVTVTWQVTNAARVELKAGLDSSKPVDASGTGDFVLTGKTTFVLTAIDASDRRTTQTIVVDYSEPKAPPVDEEPKPTDSGTVGPPSPPPPTTPTTSTGGTTTTGAK